jgi:hypothetical protein
MENEDEPLPLFWGRGEPEGEPAAGSEFSGSTSRKVRRAAPGPRFQRENVQASTPLLFFSAVTFALALATHLGLAFAGRLQSSITLLALAIGVVTLVSGLAALFLGDFSDDEGPRPDWVES